MSARVWDRASRLPAQELSDDHAHGMARVPRAEVGALAAGLPTVADLFTFMRDAELRFTTLRLRIEDRTWNAGGEQVVEIETLLRHPGLAKVTTSNPSLGVRANYEIWICDGATIRTYSAPHHLGTTRPVRPALEGLEQPELPGSSQVYRPLTALPMKSLPEAFVHPAGFCQNVLATGECRVVGAVEQGGRTAVVLECDHPRGVEVWADRPDHSLRVTVDRGTGMILRLVEINAGQVTRDATATVVEPDASLPPTAFDFAFPPDTNTIY